MTARIVTKALALMATGLPWAEAIEVACDTIATTPGARERARKAFLSLLARAERCQPTHG